MSNKLSSQYQHLWQVFNGYFHEDVQSFEEGEKELIQGTTSEYKQILVKEISDFLNDQNTTDLQKNEFISSNIRLSFRMSPLAWLKQLQSSLN